MQIISQYFVNKPIIHVALRISSERGILQFEYDPVTVCSALNLNLIFDPSFSFSRTNHAIKLSAEICAPNEKQDKGNLGQKGLAGNT